MSDKKIVVEQYRSGIGRPEAQRATLRGLGLGRVGKRRELQDTPAVRGMASAVAHLVRIVDGK